MKFTIHLANTVIAIESMFENSLAVCRDYLVDGVSAEKPDLTIEITYEDLFEELDIAQAENPEMKIRQNAAFLENLALHRKIADQLLFRDTILMHGAAVATKGHAYLFVASSGVGKSTRAKLWLEEYPESFVVDGDKPFIKLTPECPYVYGTPWCGKEKWNTRTGVPLKAIFLLERADNDSKSTIEEISFAEGIDSLVPQTYFPTKYDSTYRVINCLYGIVSHIKLYRFRSKPDLESVRLAYNAVNK